MDASLTLIIPGVVLEKALDLEPPTFDGALFTMPSSDFGELNDDKAWDLEPQHNARTRGRNSTTAGPSDGEKRWWIN